MNDKAGGWLALFFVLEASFHIISFLQSRRSIKVLKSSTGTTTAVAAPQEAIFLSFRRSTRFVRLQSNFPQQRKQERSGMERLVYLTSHVTLFGSPHTTHPRPPSHFLHPATAGRPFSTPKPWRRRLDWPVKRT